MSGLKGKKIGIAADRRSDAIERLITNMGGKPYVFPLQGKQLLDEKASRRHVGDYIRQSFNRVILTTGIGARTLGDAAIKVGEDDRFLQKLEKDFLAIRGSKTKDWLKAHDLFPDVLSADGTMENLLSQIPDVNQTEQKSIFLQTYNEDEEYLISKLEKKGYSVYKANPYKFLPPDPAIVEDLTHHITNAQLDAVVFTSKTQVKNLFIQTDRFQHVLKAFNHHVQAVAVGKVTAQALHDHGVTSVVQPDRSKMGAMIVELDKYFQSEVLNQ
ncbi:uroporphyrinogen-III synthase [Halobacillus litoralis]|uniref:uroporphyrinogen-III synthase n=1 Tax=Halobacillus litoralis TaxID=45668 RepID=UPI001CFEFBA4|nr:uroporphyrinogen-III synthase [Halobacillus litoralis]WLR46986.1 uroporphyrinogen-III synthase [Halobacillus litoralis]